MLLTPEDLKLPDEELGALLLAIFMVGEAEIRGIPPYEVDFEFASWVIERLADIETDRADLAALEKALHKAAAGETALAGRLLRSFVTSKALNVAKTNLLVKEIQNRLKRPRAGGQATAQLIRQRNAQRNQDILDTAAKLLAEGKDPRSINGILAKLFPLSNRQIRRIRK